MDSRTSTQATLSRIDVSAENDITVVVGMSRSGKSAYVKQLVRSRQNVLAWDPEGEYVLAGVTRPIYTRREWRDIVVKRRAGRFSFIRPITREEFAFWSLTVLHRGNCTAIAEETADVTSAGKAPQHWGELVRKGGKRHISIFAVTQTPTESDKTVMRNARRIVCFMVDRDPDIDYMAREMRVPRVDIETLQRLQAIIVDKHAPAGTDRASRFQHRFKASKTA